MDKSDLNFCINDYNSKQDTLRIAQDDMRQATDKLTRVLADNGMYHYLKPVNLGWLKRELS